MANIWVPNINVCEWGKLENERLNSIYFSITGVYSEFNQVTSNYGRTIQNVGICGVSYKIVE